MNTNFEKLKFRLAQIGDLQSALALLYWDQATYLPEAAHDVRATQISTLTQLNHQLSVSSELGNILEGCAKELASFDNDSSETILIQTAQRDFDRLTQVPEDFMAKMSGHYAQTYSIWAKAREAGDFSIVRANLEKV